MTRIAAGTLALLGLLTACGVAPGPDGATTADMTDATVSTHETVDIPWENDWEAAFARARTENKVVLASFEADWCVWCRRLETTTYKDRQVASLLGSRVVALSLDVEGNGRELSDTHRVDGLPTVVVFSADGRELGRIDGYLPPGGFKQRLEEILPARG